jgi:hypothetical protein
MVERTFPDGFPVHAGAEGAATSLAIVERNTDDGVTWLHSYVAEGGKCAYCIYEAPTPEAIRRTAKANGLPVDRITEVQVVDPYVYV